MHHMRTSKRLESPFDNELAAWGTTLLDRHGSRTVDAYEPTSQGPASDPPPAQGTKKPPSTPVQENHFSRVHAASSVPREEKEASTRLTMPVIINNLAVRPFGPNEAGIPEQVSNLPVKKIRPPKTRLDEGDNTRGEDGESMPQGAAHRKARIPPAGGPAVGRLPELPGRGFVERGGAEAFVPQGLWNQIVGGQTHLPAEHMGGGVDPGRDWVRDGNPFNRASVRQYMAGPITRITKRPFSVEPDMDGGGHRRATLGHDWEESLRNLAPTWRTDALLLQQALDQMSARLREKQGGADPRKLARAHATAGRAKEVVALLNPEVRALDKIVQELVKQVGVSCHERGALLNEVRLRWLEVAGVDELCLSVVGQQMSRHDEQGGGGARKVSDTSFNSTRTSKESDAARMEVVGLQDQVASLKQTVNNMEKTMDMMRGGFDGVSRDKDLADERRKEATSLMEEGVGMRDLLMSKMRVMDSQLAGAQAANKVLEMQVSELQDRVRRDALQLEALKERVAREKVRLAWLRAIAFMRRRKATMVDGFTQDGAGFGSAAEQQAKEEALEREKRAQEKSHQDKSNKVVSKEVLMGQLIPYSAFWAGVVRQAESQDLERNPELQMSRVQLLDFISKVYSEKMIADEIDDRARIARQTLPEFLYDLHLEIKGEPRQAEKALINIVANVRTYDVVSQRVHVFGRFLNLGGQPLPLEAFTIYLSALVKLQNGQFPLLPPIDNLSIEAARGLKVIEYIFAQAPSVVRSKVLVEADHISSGKYIDLDKLLAFIVEQWKEEAGRAEERLRALFVASDSDGDGNLDFGEFTGMVSHVAGSKRQRELLRMYGEMTLNKTVDCNTFVRVCRKFRFFTFEVGPIKRTADPACKPVFDLLTQEWAKVEQVVTELLVVLDGMAAANRLQQLVVILRRKMSERMDPEEAWHMYRIVIHDFVSVLRSHTPA